MSVHYIKFYIHVSTDIPLINYTLKDDRKQEHPNELNIARFMINSHKYVVGRNDIN